MGKPTNISPDSHLTYLLELNIAYQKKLDEKLDRIEKRFDRMEAYMGLSEHEKNKPTPGYTTEEVLEMYSVCRNTLLNLRNSGSLKYKKFGKKILYQKEDLEKMEFKK